MFREAGIRPSIYVFYFIWCTRTHTQGLHRYKVDKNNNSIPLPSIKWPNLPLFPSLMGKQPIQTGKTVQQILTPHGKSNLHSPTQEPGKASHTRGWETSNKGKKAKGLTPFPAKQHHHSQARISLVWDHSWPHWIKEDRLSEMFLKPCSPFGEKQGLALSWVAWAKAFWSQWKDSCCP